MTPGHRNGYHDDEWDIGRREPLLHGNGHPRPRSTEGILPSCVSRMRNVITPMRSEQSVSPSQERPNASVGKGTSKKRRLAAERQRESITGRIGTPVPAERRLTWTR